MPVRNALDLRFRRIQECRAFRIPDIRHQQSALAMHRTHGTHHHPGRTRHSQEIFGIPGGTDEALRPWLRCGRSGKNDRHHGEHEDHG